MKRFLATAGLALLANTFDGDRLATTKACLSADTLSANRIAILGRVLGDTGVVASEVRDSLGMPMIPADSISLVTSEPTCEKASAAVDSLSTSMGMTPTASRQLYLYRLGATGYAVEDPVDTNLVLGNGMRDMLFFDSGWVYRSAIPVQPWVFSPLYIRGRRVSGRSPAGLSPRGMPRLPRGAGVAAFFVLSPWQSALSQQPSFVPVDQKRRLDSLEAVAVNGSTFKDRIRAVAGIHFFFGVRHDNGRPVYPGIPARLAAVYWKSSDPRLRTEVINMMEGQADKRQAADCLGEVAQSPEALKGNIGSDSYHEMSDQYYAVRVLTSLGTEGLRVLRALQATGRVQEPLTKRIVDQAVAGGPPTELVPPR